MQPYTARYFEAIPGVWERRSSEVAQTVVVGLYPSWDVSEAAVAAADQFLGEDVPPALRRLVLEGAGRYRTLAESASVRRGEAIQGREIPADITRMALTNPSIRPPSLNADAAADTPSGAADSAPRPRTSAP